MAIYELHEFDRDKVFTGEIKPSEVVHIKYNPYEKNSVGQTVIDNNKDLSQVRNFINLNTTKASQEKFNQVVDIEIKEFLPNVIDTTIADLSNKVSELEAVKAELQTTNQLDTEKINRLNEQITTLEAKAKMTPKVLVNKIPDTLMAKSSLVSSTAKDRLLSKGRQAIAVIEETGKFSIYTGEFDEFGKPLPNTTPEIQFQKSVVDSDQVSFVDRSYPAWGTFQNTYGIWPSTSNEENTTGTFKRDVYIERDGNYGFNTTADDSCYIYMDNVKVAENQGFRANIPDVTSQKALLTKGWHTLKITYGNGGGPGGFALTITAPDGPVVPVTKQVTTREWVPDGGFFGFRTWQDVTKTVTVYEPSPKGGVIWDTRTYKAANSRNSTLPIEANGAPYVMWVYPGATDNDGQGQIELAKTKPSWDVVWGSGRTKLSKLAKVVLDDNGILNLYEGKSLVWSSYAF
jgi:hypothetical protein